MPLGSWWGDVLLSVKKEDATGTPGAGAGDGVEIEHAVCVGMDEHNSGREYERMGELVREGERPSKSAPFCLFISQTHYCTGDIWEQGPGEEWGGMCVRLMWE